METKRIELEINGNQWKLQNSTEIREFYRNRENFRKSKEIMWILPLPSHDLGIVPLFCGNFLESMRSFVFWFEMDWELDLSRRIVEWIGNSPSRKELVCSYFFTRSELNFSPLSGMNWVLHLGTWNQLYLECWPGISYLASIQNLPWTWNAMWLFPWTWNALGVLQRKFHSISFQFEFQFEDLTWIPKKSKYRVPDSTKILMQFHRIAGYSSNSIQFDRFIQAVPRISYSFKTKCNRSPRIHYNPYSSIEFQEKCKELIAT